MIFPFLRWTIVPTARLPALIALSGCLLSIDSFQWSLIVPPPTPDPLQLLPRTLTQLYSYLENCCRLALSASSLWNSWPLRRNRVREWESSLEAWEELEVTCSICFIQQSDKPMILNRDFFFWWGRDFLFLLLFCFLMGSVSSSLFLMTIFEAKKAGNIGTYHLERALE